MNRHNTLLEILCTMLNYISELSFFAIDSKCFNFQGFHMIKFLFVLFRASLLIKIPLVSVGIINFCKAVQFGEITHYLKSTNARRQLYDHQ